MPNIFAISDTWFNRLLEDDPNANVIDNNDHIIESWNEVVNKDDKIYVLGGFGIGDLYHIITRLNGEIHFLDNYFNDEERNFLEGLHETIEKSSDPTLKNRIIFEHNQILALKHVDSILSYFPLEDWSGKSTGTYCFHGLNETMDIGEHNISCNAQQWDYVPVNILEIQNNINAFKSKL